MEKKTLDEILQEVEDKAINGLDSNDLYYNNSNFFE